MGNLIFGENYCVLVSKMLLTNQVVGFFNHQYFWKEAINVFDYLHRYRSQGRIASKITVVDWVVLGVPSYVQTFLNTSKGDLSQLAFICSKSATETPEQCVKYVQGQQQRHWNDISSSCCLWTSECWIRSWSLGGRNILKITQNGSLIKL